MFLLFPISWSAIVRCHAERVPIIWVWTTLETWKQGPLCHCIWVGDGHRGVVERVRVWHGPWAVIVMVVSSSGLSGKQWVSSLEDNCGKRSLSLWLARCLLSTSQFCGVCYHAGLRALIPNSVDHMISHLPPSHKWLTAWAGSESSETGK